MAAQACCGDAGAPRAATARRRAIIKLMARRRPAASAWKASSRKPAKAAAGMRRRPAKTASRTKRALVIRRKMEALRSLVPPPATCCAGDHQKATSRRLEDILLNAAGYILRLQMQVRAMQLMLHALIK